MNSIGFPLGALVKFLSGQKIKYAVLGGIAVSIYGEPRFTADIDVNIIFDRDDLAAFIRNAGKYGFKSSTPKALDIARTMGVVPMDLVKRGRPVRFEFIIAENALEYAAIKRGKLKKIGPIKIRMVTPEDLIIHKMASSRPRDGEDVKGILARQAKKLDLAYIRNWLKRIDSANKGCHLNARFNRLLLRT